MSKSNEANGQNYRMWNGRVMEYFNLFDFDYKPDHESLMQSTGLLDKNGKEIFEGDTVKQNLCVSYGGDGYGETVDIDSDFIGEVVVLPSKGVCLKKPLVIDNYDGTQTRSNNYLNVRKIRAELIGNVYENPELMEKSNGKG